MLVQVVNFIDVLYTLHSHFNHESTDFTGYHGKRVNFMPAYLHVHSNRDIERIPSKRKKKKRIFFSLDGRKFTFTVFSIVRIQDQVLNS